jgi:hypothetical protein
VSEAEVAAVLELPDREEQSISDRINAYRNVEDRLLKVTHIREGSNFVVVTVIEKQRERE